MNAVELLDTLRAFIRENGDECKVMVYTDDGYINEASFTDIRWYEGKPVFAVQTDLIVDDED